MWSWKNWIGYAGVLSAFVLISFIVEWSIRTKGKVFWLDGLIRWWADFVMFGWVKDYQTLLGGLLALGAGAFALLAVRYQRQTFVADRTAEQHSDAISTIYTVRGFYQRLILAGFKNDAVSMREASTDIRKMLAEVTRFAPGLADWLQFALHEIDEGIDHFDEERARYRDVTPDYAIGIATIARAYLTDADRLFMNGRYRHAPRHMDTGDVTTLKVARLDLDKVALAKGMLLLPES